MNDGPSSTEVAFLDSETGEIEGVFQQVSPKFDKKERQYMLDLDGTGEVASVKNLVIAGKGKSNILYLGKRKDKSLYVKFTAPFSPVEALAVAISTL